jgi:hypothetical protein
MHRDLEGSERKRAEELDWFKGFERGLGMDDRLFPRDRGFPKNNGLIIFYIHLFKSTNFFIKRITAQGL